MSEPLGTMEGTGNHDPSIDDHLTDYNNSSNIVQSPTTVTNLSYIGGMLGISILVMIISVIVYRFIKRIELVYTLSPDTLMALQPEWRRFTCGHYCTFTIHFGLGNSNPPPAIVNQPVRHAHTLCIDVPPSYDSFVNVEKDISPPTYNEALKHMSNIKEDLPPRTVTSVC